MPLKAFISLLSILSAVSAGRFNNVNSGLLSDSVQFYTEKETSSCMQYLIMYKPFSWSST